MIKHLGTLLVALLIALPALGAPLAQRGSSESTAAAARAPVLADDRGALERDDDNEETSRSGKDDEDDGPWSGAVSAGLVSLTGNSDTFTVSGDALLEYRSRAWELFLEVLGTYGNAAGEGEGERENVALWVKGLGRVERRFTPLLSAYVLLGAETNRLASITARLDAEAGLGLTFLERERDGEEWLYLRGYVGAHVSNDFRFQYEPVGLDLDDLFLAGPGVGAVFRWSINDRLELSELVEAYAHVLGDWRFVAFSHTKLSAFVTERLALSVHFLVEHDSEPAPEKVSTDTSLTVGVEFAF